MQQISPSQSSNFRLWENLRSMTLKRWWVQLPHKTNRSEGHKNLQSSTGIEWKSSWKYKATWYSYIFKQQMGRLFNINHPERVPRSWKANNMCWPKLTLQMHSSHLQHQSKEPDGQLLCLPLPSHKHPPPQWRHLFLCTGTQKYGFI